MPDGLLKTIQTEIDETEGNFDIYSPSHKFDVSLWECTLNMCTVNLKTLTNYNLYYIFEYLLPGDDMKLTSGDGFWRWPGHIIASLSLLYLVLSKEE